MCSRLSFTLVLTNLPPSSMPPTTTNTFCAVTAPLPSEVILGAEFGVALVAHQSSGLKRFSLLVPVQKCRCY
jgi:hypothetical protein